MRAIRKATDVLPWRTRHADDTLAMRRFGFHNLRHSLASFLTPNKKTDVKTLQRSLCNSSSSTTLDKYVQTDMDELIAAKS